jgi:hypothetical protein
MPTIWADDGNQYTMIDDGGTDIKQPGALWRQSLAVITGTPPHIRFKHVGDPNAPPPHTFAQIQQHRDLWTGPLGPGYSSGRVAADNVGIPGARRSAIADLVRIAEAVGPNSHLGPAHHLPRDGLRLADPSLPADLHLLLCRLAASDLAERRGTDHPRSAASLGDRSRSSRTNSSSDPPTTTRRASRSSGSAETGGICG